MPSISAGLRISIILVSVPIGTILILLGVLFALSPGKVMPFSDADGTPLIDSISENIHVSIKGVEQGMFIKGQNKDNPVLLFLHGGTAMPEYFLTQKYRTGLDEYFTVCWWERRGAGLSFRTNTPLETVTLEQSISDTLEVTEYLRSRFDKDKIYLMAHSGGSVIGIQAAAQKPEIYSAYIGVGQISYQLESELQSYEYMVEQYKENGNMKMARRLEAAPPTMSTPLPATYMKIRDKAMHKLGVGTTRDMKSVITGVFLASWLFPEYSLSEKLALWKGKFSSDKLLWDKMISMNLTKEVPGLNLPTYFFHGKYDYTVSYSLAKEYLATLRAPIKGFYTFENSAHSPMFEEPEKMQQIFLQDVFTGTNSHSDRD